MSKQVFISYARSGSHAEACAVRDKLEGAGVSVFLDKRDIPPGEEFPQDIADALLQARVVLIVADKVYFERPWCVYEYRVAMAPSRTGAGDADVALRHVVVALPPSGDLESICAHLPPSVAKRAWPLAGQHDKLVGVIQRALADATQTLAERLEGLDDEAVRTLRTGGAVPRPSALSGCPGYYRDVPASLKGGFIGRTDVLWRVFHELETRRAGAVSLSCAILGGAGSGKTQLAAEYLWRYGPKHYPGGLVWINADCDKETLRLQLSNVLEAFDPGASPGGSLEEIGPAVERAVAAVARERAVLWVVDNIPEPTSESPALSMSSWCPASRHVSLLCTSRWAGMSAIDSKIRIDALAEATAVDLLTQPPVERAWLSYDQWIRIVEWVGGLPLALEALRVSLAGGFADATELWARANEDEPAAAVDAEVDILRGEVSDEHLRGVTNALQVAYDRMAKDDKARRGAHLLARLSPYPIASEFLSKLVGTRERGVLANRSWLQSTAPPEERPGERYWRMHRIYSSYLRGRSTDPDAELSELAQRIQQMCEDVRQRLMLKDHSTHLVVLVHAFQRRFSDGALGARAFDAGRQMALALATGRIGEGNGTATIRSDGAELADSLGVADEIVERLRAVCKEGGEDVCGKAANLLGYMPRSRSAAEFLAELLSDPSESVRQQALNANLSSRHADILALPALKAILSVPASEEGPLDTPSFFSNVFEQDVPALPDGVISLLAERLAHDVDAERRRALDILQSIHSKMIGQCEPDDPRLKPVEAALREAALHATDRELACSAARTMGTRDDPDTYEALVAALHDAPSAASRVRLLDALGNYLHGAEEDELPKVQLIWRDGQQFMHLSPPRPRSASPKLFEPLVQYAVAGDEPVLMELALEVLLGSEAGEPLLLDAVGQLVESDEMEQLEEVSEATVRVKPDEPHGYWWRGIAAEKLGRVGDAIDDYGRVIELSPQFDQAYFRRARLRGGAGDLPGARQDIEALIERNPNDAGLLVLHGQLWFDGEEYEKAICDIDAAIAIRNNAPGAFLLKGHSLIYLNRLPEAIESLSRAIELAPSEASAWHLRAWARANDDDLRGALQDIETLYAMAPDYAPATELRDALRAESEKPPLE